MKHIKYLPLLNKLIIERQHRFKTCNYCWRPTNSIFNDTYTPSNSTVVLSLQRLTDIQLVYFVKEMPVTTSHNIERLKLTNSF